MLDIEPDFGELSLLKFKDFVPEQLSKNPWTGKGKYESLGQMVREINHWMALHPGIDVMNIETVVLPNIHENKEEGSEDTELPPSAMGQYIWHQFFRVWYVDKRG